MKKKALITGASSGIGEIFSDRLAAMDINLIITARRESLLIKRKKSLESRYNISVKIVVADLSKQEDIDLLRELIIAEKIDYLINNAGYANIGNFHEIKLEKHKQMLNVHINTVVEFTYAAIPHMISNNFGVIINVSSIAGLIKKSSSSLYGPTKAFLISLSYSINSLVKNSNIIVQALCPGYTYSGFHKTEEYISKNKDTYNTVPKFFWMTSEKVVDHSLKKLKKNRVVVIPGLKNRIALKLINVGILRR